MQDVANSYIQEQMPLSDEEFQKQLKLAESGAAVEPQSPLYSPEDDSTINLDPIVATPEDAEPEDKPDDIFGYAKDIASGAVMGWIDGGTEIVHTIGNVADVVNSFAGGDPEYFTKKANELAPRMTPERYAELGLKVPVTTAGQITKSGVQFLEGFVPALRAMRGIGALVKGTGTVARTVQGVAGTGTAGAIADLSAFNPYEQV